MRTLEKWAAGFCNTESNLTMLQVKCLSSMCSSYHNYA